jgi:hypothetical protein
MTLPKILVCAPTSVQKDYCFNDWIENVGSFTYPNFDVFLCDNSNDIEYSKNINSYVYHNYPFLFYCFHYSLSDKNLMTKIAYSHDVCRQILVSKNYDYMLHLETDVFPQKDIIERLLWNNKDVCGAVYYTDEGINRKPVIQRIIQLSDNKNDILSINFEPNEDFCFIDGDVKKVGHVGLGCVLIKKEVFNKVGFRADENYPNHSADSFFASDCYDNDIDIYVDTSLIAKHKNRKWIL